MLMHAREMPVPYFAHDLPHEIHSGPLDPFIGTALAAFAAGVVVHERFRFAIKRA
jgi:hypothetical protein